MLVALGDRIRERRKAQRASLETVGAAAHISGPYVLKLERGEVNSPSPRVLARIARALNIPYLELMELAGYLDEEDLAALRGRTPRPHPLAGQSLSPEEWRRVGQYISDLVARRGTGAPPGPEA